jgi:RNA polymerase sigma-70 factor (ECF subfamily)
MEPVAGVPTIATVEVSALSLDDIDAVMRAWWPAVYRFALTSLRDTDAAASIAQDCFLKAYRGRERFRGDCGLRVWLMRIAVNLIRDHTRNRRLQFWKRAGAPAPESLGEDVADETLSPEAQASARQQVEAVWRACESLPERQRTVFLLRFVEELELLEIAAVTGMAEGTVKAHLFRALQSVRRRMGRNP